MFFLSCVNETIHLLGNLPFFKIHVNCFMARGESPCAILSQNACCGRWAWYNTLCLRHSFIWLAACYQVYNALLKTSKGALFLSPSEVYVRSFLYPHLHFNKTLLQKALSDPALSLAPGWSLLLWGQGYQIHSQLMEVTFQNCICVWRGSYIFIFFFLILFYF